MSRLMKAKLLKMKKRKIKLKRQSAGPTKGWATEYAQRAKWREPDHWLKVFGVDVTQATQNHKRHKLGLSSSIKRSSREEIVEKLQQLVEKAPLEHHICLFNSEYQKTFLFWSGHRYFFVRKYFHMYTKSVIYLSREEALTRWEANRITWDHTIDIPETLEE